MIGYQILMFHIIIQMLVTEMFIMCIYHNIFKVIDDPKSLPKDQYKVPLDEFEKKTKTNFKFLRREIDDLFHTQILSGNLEQDIWIFIPKELR